MGIGYRWHSLRRRLRTLGSESLLLRQFLAAGVLYLAVWGLVQVNLPLTNNMVHHIHWSVAEYKPDLGWERLRSWGEQGLNLPVLSALRAKEQQPVSASLLGYVFPVEGGQVVSRYGWRLHPVSQEKRFHQGIDIAAPSGTPIQAIAGGYVSRIREEELLGKVLEIKHANGIVSLYGHLETVLVEPRQAIKSGDPVATVGSSGVTTGTHLHLEIKERGINVDPAIKLGLVEEAIVPTTTPMVDDTPESALPGEEDTKSGAEASTS